MINAALQQHIVAQGKHWRTAFAVLSGKNWALMGALYSRNVPMRVDLRTLNPSIVTLRSTIDHIAPDILAPLKESMQEDGFGGIACRWVNGTLQIAADHHHIRAALAAGIARLTSSSVNTWTAPP